MRRLQILIATTLTGLAPAQVDSRLWLVQSPAVAASGLVFEIDRTGAVVATWPGPPGGTRSVVKDPYVHQVYVVDDAGGRIFVYASGTGLVNTVAAPGIKSAAVMSNGDIALLVDGGFLQPGRVQIIPRTWFSTPSVPWPAPIPVGFVPTRLLAGPNETLWILDGFSFGVTRLQSGASQSLGFGAVAQNSIQGIHLRPDGGLVATFNQSAIAVRVSAAGAIEGTIVLPEAALHFALDADTSAIMLGVSGALRSLDPRTGAVDWSVFLGAGTNVTGLIPDHQHAFWIEDAAGPAVVKFGWGGAVLATVPLPAATSTAGDPLGLEFGGKANPAIDLDNDGVSTAEEMHFGSDPLDPGDLPAFLIVGPPVGGIASLGLYAPSRGGQVAYILASLSGSQSTALGPDNRSAPYLDLNSDLLTSGLVAGSLPVGSLFLGMPAGVLNTAGLAYAGVNFGALALPPGSVTLSLCAVILQGGTAYGVTSNSVTLTN